MARRSPQERFQGLSEEAPSGCVLWLGKSDRYGYGWFWLDRKNVLAHRQAWIWAHGHPPSGQCVLHRCDQRLCVRVDHLFLGTPLENSADMVLKGRNRVGPTPLSERLPNGRYRVRFARRPGRQKLPGTFATAEEAVAAGLTARRAFYAAVLAKRGLV